MFRACVTLVAVSVGAFGSGSLRAADWTHLAGDAARRAIAPAAPCRLDRVLWTATNEPDEEYVFHSSPVVHDGRVFINARRFADGQHVGNSIIAYDAQDGTRLWSAPLAPDTYDSWSSPAIDVCNETVLIACDDTLYALRAADGELAWATMLDRPVVNASPAVSRDLVSNGSPANRAFITDYDGFGNDAKLYAVNVDPFDAADNPYQPGDIAWVAGLPGASGNTPAYEGGTVYVASVTGEMRAYSAADGQPVWQAELDLSGYPPYTGFYGGVTVRYGYVYAAAYGFYGGQNNSVLFKLDGATGDVVWEVPCERTQSIPVVTGSGLVLLSGGIDGFGSAVKVQAFRDLGNQVEPLWDTYQDTSGTLIVGGWTQQPVYSHGLLYAGTPDFSQFFGPYAELYVLDVSQAPTDPGFVVSHYSGSGGSPAAANGGLYSCGSRGLSAFGRCLPDSEGDGTQVEPTQEGANES